MSSDKRRRTLEDDGEELFVRSFGSKWTYIKHHSAVNANASIGIHRDEIPWVIAQLAASGAGLPQLPAILAELFRLVGGRAGDESRFLGTIT